LRIAVIGGGPGGLYFAYLWKNSSPTRRSICSNRMPPAPPLVWSSVFRAGAGILRADDPDTVDAILPRMESWKNITLNLRGESVRDRRRRLLVDRPARSAHHPAAARRLGRVTPRYDTPIQSVDQLTGYDLIVAADGLNRWRVAPRGRIRRVGVPFGQSICIGTAPQNGSRRCRQTFVETGLGAFNAITIDTRLR